MSHAILASAFGTRSSIIAIVFVRSIRKLISYWMERRALKSLRAMDDRLLEDIGITRGDLFEWSQTGVCPEALKR